MEGLSNIFFRFLVVYGILLTSLVKIDKIFEHKTVNIFLTISFKMCLGCSKELIQ